MVSRVASLPVPVPVVGLVLGGSVCYALASLPRVLGTVLGAVRVAAAARLGWKCALGVASPLSWFCAKSLSAVAVGVVVAGFSVETWAG